MNLDDFTSLLAQLEGGYLSPYWLLAPIVGDQGMTEREAGDFPHLGDVGRWAYHPAAVWLKAIAPAAIGDAQLLDWQARRREYFRTAAWRSMFYDAFRPQLRGAGLSDLDFSYLGALVEAAPSVRWAAESAASALGVYPMRGRQMNQPFGWPGARGSSDEYPPAIPAGIAAAYTRAIKLELVASYQRVLSLLEARPRFHLKGRVE